MALGSLRCLRPPGRPFCRAAPKSAAGGACAGGSVSDGFDMNTAYWKPYTQRRCVDWLSDREVRVALAQARQPLYVVLKDEGCKKYFQLDVADWLRTYGATPLRTVEIRVLAHQAPHQFTLARLEPRSDTRGGAPAPHRRSKPGGNPGGVRSCLPAAPRAHLRPEPSV